jgi:hypothetical protein
MIKRNQYPCLRRKLGTQPGLSRRKLRASAGAWAQPCYANTAAPARLLQSRARDGLPASSMCGCTPEHTSAPSFAPEAKPIVVRGSVGAPPRLAARSGTLELGARIKRSRCGWLRVHALHKPSLTPGTALRLITLRIHRLESQDTFRRSSVRACIRWIVVLDFERC